ncbi:MAG: hypothetical protein IPP64_11905 [Bacteroidetes bacterium]|nr:hypothetical protein [Bacteroidota bacterium]
MTISEIQNNLVGINQINNLTACFEYSYSASLKFLQLDDFVVHRIELLNNSYDSSVSNTTIELAGVSIGDIFYLKDHKFETASLSGFQFYAYLKECELADIALPDYTFKYNYLLIHKDYIDEFHLKYSSTSAVWGGFKISENTNVINYYKKQIPTITIPDELKELDFYAQDSIFRALDQKHSFERYLKLYHLLELEFDYSLIKKIQTLNITTDSNLIGSLLNEYTRTENDQLYDLISSKCSNIFSLALKLNGVKPYQALGEEIFIKFGKNKGGSLFLNDLTKYNALLTDVDSFISTSSVKTHVNISLTDYNKFIHTVTAYWIYRIRCSIAHFKIGEYILTRDKEDFIVEFAEPLIKEVLIQFYKK